MAKKTTLSDIAKVMDFKDKKSDSHYWGRVESVNTDSSGKVKSYNVALGDGAGSVTCRKLAGAKAGDTVMVTLRATGEAIVTGTAGGDTDAQDAQNAADDAKETAESVQEDLDENYSTTEEVEEMIATMPGGAKIYYQTSAPEGTFKVGDTWFDTDDGYKIYRWNGSSWQALQFGSSALAADSVTASQIAAGAVTASEIAAGAVTAAKIYAGAITVEKLSSAVKTGIENAAKIASNYLAYDSANGLVVSATGGTSPSGENVQIKSGGMYVRDGTTQLAKFEASSAQIGASTAKNVVMSSEGIAINDGSTEVAKFTEGELMLDADTSTEECALVLGSCGEIRSNGTTITVTGNRTLYLDGGSGGIYTANNMVSEGIVTAKAFDITNTTTCSTYAGMSSSKRLHKWASSARRFKENIRPLSDDQKENIRKLYDTEVFSWKYKDDHIAEGDDFYGKTIFGLIAEDAVKAVPELEQLDENGEIENYKDRLLLNALLVLVQDQHQETEELKSDIRSITARVEALENRKS